MSSKTKGAIKDSSAIKRRVISVKAHQRMPKLKESSASKKQMVSVKSYKRMLPIKNASKKRSAKVPLMNKRSVSSKSSRGKILRKKPLSIRSPTSLKKQTKAPVSAKNLMPSLSDIKEVFGFKERVKGSNSRKPSSAGTSSTKKLMPSNNERKAQGSLDSAGTAKSDTKAIQKEANGQTAEAIIVEDKEKAEVQNVNIVEAEKRNCLIQ